MSESIAIFGSARRGGNTGKFIDLIAREIGIEVVDLAEKNISPYDYEHKNIDDDFVPLMKQLLGYKNIFFVSPVYWYAPSAQLKIFIDRTSDFLDVEELKYMGRSLRGKMAYVVRTSVSKDADSSFINSFRDTFEYLGMNYGGYIHADCENGFAPDKYQEEVTKFVNNFKSKSNV